MGGSEGKAGDAREGQASCELYVAALGPRDDGLFMPLMSLRVSLHPPAINSAPSPFPYNPNTSLGLCRFDSSRPRDVDVETVATRRLPVSLIILLN